jgi:hypothetical protein
MKDKPQEHPKRDLDRASAISILCKTAAIEKIAERRNAASSKASPGEEKFTTHAGRSGGRNRQL